MKPLVWAAVTGAGRATCHLWHVTRDVTAGTLAPATLSATRSPGWQPPPEAVGTSVLLGWGLTAQALGCHAPPRPSEARP